jgi:hypothetical protein
MSPTAIWLKRDGATFPLAKGVWQLYPANALNTKKWKWLVVSQFEILSLNRNGRGPNS